ncbi:RNA polymerase sigma-70 factor [Chitinophaga horti]|uniref:RNA polymerase sigma-70 factor n=1 Tax=Chitinophaga horti TaxID=2920382 RepID=A0ABY6J7T0_9BACT|nr:RNA polymerase sigma-70 factor [Chitinophaga horti]UYQ95748.1 RNA polymerase sigma-70 factor [Chitinophaga horti]
MQTNQPYSEIELIRLFREGTGAGTAALYEKYYRGLVYFARQIIEHEGEAEDIAQESMIKLFNKRTDFDNLSDIKSFLYVSVRNSCFNYLKARDRHELSHQELLYLSPEGEEKADLEMLKSRVLAEVFNEIDRLPEQCGNVFKLLFIKKMSTAAVAEQLGISPQTVLNQKSRALKLLRFRLSDKGFFALLLLLKTF